MRTQLHHLLEEGAVRFGDRPALSHQEVTLDYASAWTLASRTGAVLSGLGVARGDRVAVYLDKRPETIGGIFGTSVAGGVFVPVNPALKGSQVAYILGDCDVRVLITTHQRWESVREDAKGCRALAHVLLVDADPGVVPDEDEVRVHALSALLGDAVDPPPPSRGDRRRHGRDPLHVRQHGPPQGRRAVAPQPAWRAPRASRTYLGNDRRRRHPGRAAAQLRRRAQPGDDGLRRRAPTSCCSTTCCRATSYGCAPEHGVTGLTCVPPLWIQLAAADWPARGHRSLRYFANTGGRMPRPTLDRLREIFPQAAPLPDVRADRGVPLDLSRPGRGRPPPGLDRQGHPERRDPRRAARTARPATPGEHGELVHRGALVAQGYWNDPERTAERFRPLPGGPTWRRRPELAVWSGDTVYRDEEGFLYFVGRTDDMIKTSGYRVSPTEIEEVAYATGLVARGGRARPARRAARPPGRARRRPRRPEGFSPARCSARRFRRQLPRYMVPAQIDVRDRAPQLGQRQVRPGAAARKELTA